MYDDYSLYLYRLFSVFIDYGAGIKVWGGNLDIKIELSQEDGNKALKMDLRLHHVTILF